MPGKPSWKISAGRDLPKTPPQPAEHQQEFAVFSFRYFDVKGEYCLSECNAEDVGRAVDALHRMSQMTWQQILQTGGKKQKVGLHFTPYDDNALNVKRPSSIDKELRICGFRMGAKGRVFGFRRFATFHLLWVDPNHEITDG